ncbi:MAG: hemin uptake protein HemP [Yersinia sp. (in: enterobacteria)]
MNILLNKSPTLNHEPAVDYQTAIKPMPFTSEQLLREHGVAFIIHQGECYQLRQVRAGKPILTK